MGYPTESDLQGGGEGDPHSTKVRVDRTTTEREKGMQGDGAGRQSAAARPGPTTFRPALNA